MENIARKTGGTEGAKMTAAATTFKPTVALGYRQNITITLKRGIHHSHVVQLASLQKCL